MRKLLKWLGITLGIVLIAGIVAGIIAHRPLPEGQPGPEAGHLAEQMLAAIDKEAWDSTRYVRWAFPGGHLYVWDKFRQNVQIEWGDKRVLLHTPTQKGKAWQGGKEQQGDQAEKLLAKAWSFFCNDSFWLNAPAKVFDPGASREWVELEGGEKGLLVRYSSGGVTPGDAYLWRLTEEGLPASWQMWVSIIPIGGLKTSWEEWITLETGARLATLHRAGLFTVELSGVSGGNSLQSVGLSEDPFLALQ